MPTNTEQIRNFCIIAHIDHGKSTLADRLLEVTGTITKREMKEQFLDKMDIERERGITIKAQTVRMNYKARDGKTYVLNLIDTPGHVDFHYEVSRSLAACEGALLVVDAVQGVEAQTVANAYMAIENNLEIVPVINKMDLPAADPDRVKKEVEDVVGISAAHAVLASAKTGLGVEDILEAVIEKILPPEDKKKEPLKALLFDAWFDAYLGVVVQIRIFEGSVRKGDKIRMMFTGKDYEVLNLGTFSPNPTPIEELGSGEVGFLTAAVKSVHETRIGDTITHADRPAVEPLGGFKEVKPMVFSGIYPVDSADYEQLKVALEKLQLNDSSFQYEPETSKALGFGFRCGFLGLLHVEIIRERLEREYNLKLISTAPMVIFKVKKTNGEELEVRNPGDMPHETEIAEMSEPYIKATIHLPKDYVGNIIQLCSERRGEQIAMNYPTTERVELIYEIPFSEIMFDFFDKLKSATQGYASFDYELLGWKKAELIRLNIMINGELVDALSVILNREKAYLRGREIVSKLREEIPRQQFEIALQAAIGMKIIARETVKPLRKNVISKCYGGDITRKRKLLEKQKEGKKRMKQVGNVEIPQEAFLSVLKVD